MGITIVISRPSPLVVLPNQQLAVTDFAISSMHKCLGLISRSKT